MGVCVCVREREKGSSRESQDEAIGGWGKGGQG